MGSEKVIPPNTPHNQKENNYTEITRAKLSATKFLLILDEELENSGLVNKFKQLLFSDSDWQTMSLDFIKDINAKTERVIVAFQAEEPTKLQELICASYAELSAANLISRFDFSPLIDHLFKCNTQKDFDSCQNYLQSFLIEQKINDVIKTLRSFPKDPLGKENEHLLKADKLQLALNEIPNEERGEALLDPGIINAFLTQVPDYISTGPGSQFHSYNHMVEYAWRHDLPYVVMQESPKPK